MIRRVSYFLFAAILLCTIFPSIASAKKYTIEECKKTTTRAAMSALMGASPVSPVYLRVVSSKEDPRSLVISGKTIPRAYLVALEKNPHASRDVYFTKEAKKILKNTPIRLFDTIRCPSDMSDAKEKAEYRKAMLNAMIVIDAYANEQLMTPTLKEFMRQFIEHYDKAKDKLNQETKNILPEGYSMKTLWGIRESFTDYSFQKLHIAFDYCAYFINKNIATQEDIEKERKNCFEERLQRFEYVVLITGQSEGEISKFLDAKAKELNTVMYQYFKLMIQREINDSI